MWSKREFRLTQPHNQVAESILRKLGGGHFKAFSAGSHPKGSVNPFALKTLEAYDYPTEGLRSKSWGEFATPDAPNLDFAFTVCDDAAGGRVQYGRDSR